MVNNVEKPADNCKGKGKVTEENKKVTSRKRSGAAEKANSEPVKKPRLSKKSQVKSASSASTYVVEVGSGQPLPSP